MTIVSICPLRTLALYNPYSASSCDRDWADKRIEMFRPQTVVAYSGSFFIPERKISSRTRRVRVQPWPFRASQVSTMSLIRNQLSSANVHLTRSLIFAKKKARCSGAPRGYRRSHVNCRPRLQACTGLVPQAHTQRLLTLVNPGLNRRLDEAAPSTGRVQRPVRRPARGDYCAGDITVSFRDRPGPVRKF